MSTPTIWDIPHFQALAIECSIPLVDTIAAFQSEKIAVQCSTDKRMAILASFARHSGSPIFQGMQELVRLSLPVEVRNWP